MLGTRTISCGPYKHNETYFGHANSKAGNPPLRAARWYVCHANVGLAIEPGSITCANSSFMTRKNKGRVLILAMLFLAKCVVFFGQNIYS